MSKLNWDDLRYFLALAEQGTLSAAARTLSVTHATMARRITQLEQEIGTPAFDQKPSGYALTERGERIFEMASTIREQVAAIVDSVEPEAAKGTVRLSATPYLCNEVVRKNLRNIIEDYPQIEIELLATNQNADLLRHEAHLALRLQRPGKGDYTIRRLGYMPFGLFGHEKFRDNLEAAPLVVYSEELEALPESKWLNEHLPGNPVSLRTNSLACQISAIEEGIGIGLVPLYATENAERAVLLEHSPDTWTREVWLVMRATLSKVPRIRLVSDLLFENFKSWRLNGSR